MPKSRGPRSGVPTLYFFQGVDGGPIKIGVSRDIAARLADCQVGSPARLHVICSVPGGRAAEREVQARFASGHLHGEWYSEDTPGLLEFIEELRDGRAELPEPEVSTLTELRSRAGKSRVAVAADLGLSERHLYRLERGLSPLTRRWVLVFATYYGVDPEELEA